MSVGLKFAWFDLWIGAFIERHHPDHPLVVYVCPLPCVLFTFRFGADNQDKEDDIAIAEQVRERDANDTGERLTIEELTAEVLADNQAEGTA